MKKARILFLLAIFTILIPLFFCIKPVAAQEKSNFQKALEKCEEGQMNQECWVANTVKSVSSSFGEGIANSGEDGEPSGMLPVLTDQIAYMIDRPPASSVEYLADLGQKLGIAPPAFAQDNSTGWRALAPFLEIWKAFRNLSYVFFVFIFIIVGFMIMFRSKIDPQTVITVQSALPKIVVTLLLITFSYAIAGLMIDLIYVIIYAFVGLFQFTGLVHKDASSTIIDNLLKKNLFKLTFTGKKLFARAPAKAIDDLVKGLFNEQSAFQEAIGNIIGKIAGSLGFTFLVFVLFFNVAKIFFALAKTYVSIIVQIIFAPIVILFNAIPGNNSFQSWLKSLFANIMVFPAVGIMFLVAALMMGNRSHVKGPCDSSCDPDLNPWCVTCDVGYYAAEKNNDPVWVPPLFGFFSVAENTAGAPILTVIGFGMVLMIAKVPEMVKSAFGVEDKMGGMIAQQVIGGVSSPIRYSQSYKQFRRQRISDKVSQAQLKDYKRRRTAGGSP